MSDQNVTGKTRKGPPKCRVFCMSLKADEPKQVYALSQVLKYPQLYRAVYILHDKDRYSPADMAKYKENNDDKDPEWTVGDVKEPHYHVCVRTPTPSTWQTLSNRLGVGVLEVRDEFGYLLYMLHDTYECEQEREYKHLYDVADLKGDYQRISMLMMQNGHFAQLQALMDLMDKGHTIRSTVMSLNQCSDAPLVQTLMSDNAVRTIWLQAQRQEERKLLNYNIDSGKADFAER